MSAAQLWLDEDLNSAVLAGVLSLEQAWLLQDELLIQQSETIRLPMEWLQWVAKLELFQMRSPTSRLQ